MAMPRMWNKKKKLTYSNKEALSEANIMLKPRAIAWRPDAKIHLVDVDEFNRKLSNFTLCGLKIPYSDVWELDSEITCKRCLKKLEKKKQNR